MRIQHRSAFDQKIHQARIAIVQHAESARPPLGALPYVGARFQQHIDRRPIAPLYRGKHRVQAEAVIGQRIVDLRPQLRMFLEQLPYPRRIAVAHRRLQRLCRSEPQRLHMRLQLCPGRKAVFVGERMLRVRQFALPSQCSAAVLWLVSSEIRDLAFEAAHET